MTELLFNEDSYLKEAEAKVISIKDNIIKLNRTIFYPEGGGQPGDNGKLVLKDRVLNVIDTKKGEQENEILHYVEGNIDESIINQEVGLKIDWDRRYKLMRMHSSCHVLVSLVPALITGASVGIEKSRIDFDVDPSTLNKEEMNQRIREIVSEDHPIFINQISGDNYEEYKHLSKGAAVSPPVINNKIQIVQIGEDNNIIDAEFCSGTHCKSTKEIGPLEIGKIENKGKRNRRINIRFSS
jgi:misacylated tRNA(Ala) deacylase